MTVYVAQEPHPNRPIDLSSAENFGPINYVFNFADPVSIEPDESYRKAREILWDFDPDKDFILDCGGDQMALGVVVHFLATEGECDVLIPFLRWDRREQGYQPSRIGMG